MTSQDFLDYGMIITSYGTLSIEHLPHGSETAPTVPRKSGRCICTGMTKAARAVFSVLAHSRWVLTGTPIVSSLKDLQSFVRFTGLTGGLEGFEVFNGVLVQPLKAGL